jgi:hypothetical protein
MMVWTEGTRGEGHEREPPRRRECGRGGALGSEGSVQNGSSSRSSKSTRTASA